MHNARKEENNPKTKIGKENFPPVMGANEEIFINEWLLWLSSRQIETSKEKVKTAYDLIMDRYVT